MKPFTHVWFWRTRLPHRKGQPLRILVRAGRLNSVLVEFQDGHRCVTSLNAIRKLKPPVNIPAGNHAQVKPTSLNPNPISRRRS